VIDGDVEIVPPGARKPATHLIIQAELAVLFERELHRRQQHIVAFFVGDPAARDNADDVVGQFFDQLEHRAIPTLALSQSWRSAAAASNRGRCRLV